MREEASDRVNRDFLQKKIAETESRKTAEFHGVSKVVRKIFSCLAGWNAKCVFGC